VNNIKLLSYEGILMSVSFFYLLDNLPNKIALSFFSLNNYRYSILKIATIMLKYINLDGETLSLYN